MSYDVLRDTSRTITCVKNSYAIVSEPILSAASAPCKYNLNESSGDILQSAKIVCKLNWKIFSHLGNHFGS